MGHGANNNNNKNNSKNNNQNNLVLKIQNQSRKNYHWLVQAFGRENQRDRDVPKPTVGLKLI